MFINAEHLDGLTTATANNIIRKSTFVDRVKLNNRGPIPSWIDLNPTELCNRKCVFCPRVDEDEYPNQALHISLDTVNNVKMNLLKIGFEGVIALSGYGEPLLHPKLADVVQILASSRWRIELVTNGDRLTTKVANELIKAGLNYFVVSMYDGPEQQKHFQSVFAGANIETNRYVLRDRWYDETLNYGVKLTNRTGNVTIGVQQPISLKKPCYYPSYSLSLDWNGDVLLCVQDWDKKVKFGNINVQSLEEIWFSKYFQRVRQNLIDGNRAVAPCKNCNALGVVHGENHAKAWRQNHNIDTE
jgi:radical SAM protein with 4Fe4S-binding SPASM domain